MQVQFNEIDLHIEMTGEPCEMSVEEMAEWFKNYIEGLGERYDGSISVEVSNMTRRTRNIGSNEV